MVGYRVGHRNRRHTADAIRESIDLTALPSRDVDWRIDLPAAGHVGHRYLGFCARPAKGSGTLLELGLMRSKQGGFDSSRREPVYNSVFDPGRHARDNGWVPVVIEIEVHSKPPISLCRTTRQGSSNRHLDPAEQA